MTNTNKPAATTVTTADFMEQLRTSASLGWISLEAWVREFNNRIPEIATRAENRAESRETFAVTKGEEDYQAWLRSEREARIDARRAEYDREHPPIYVPERVELVDAKRFVEEHASK